ncbi:hypothetical protein, partial [Bradyrhizobium cytisi]|uniref:hypothetical protein n=1 Tax=Bradyrhizobium cytisi TaxID=515489 RepID=UPI001AEE2B47
MHAVSFGHLEKRSLIARLHRVLDTAAGNGSENGKMVIDRAGQIGLSRHEAMVDVADASRFGCHSACN